MAAPGHQVVPVGNGARPAMRSQYLWFFVGSFIRPGPGASGRVCLLRYEVKTGQTLLIYPTVSVLNFDQLNLPDPILHWKDGLVPAIVRHTFSGNLDNLPVLADALEEAGYTEEKLLKACRKKDRAKVEDCLRGKLLYRKD